jgi:nicotinamidase-related amidase
MGGLPFVSVVDICAVGDDGGMPGLVLREDSVLVVVDAQPGFLAKKTFNDAENAAARSALARMAWLVAVAARLELPVIVTEEEPDRHGSTAAEVASVLPEGAAVYRKPTFGLANTPEILAAVRETQRQTAVVIGCETDVCVAQSAIGLVDHGFSCVVVEDATFSPGEMHARGLERLASAGVARNHAKGVTYEWLRSVDDAHIVLRASGLPAPPFPL